MMVRQQNYSWNHILWAGILTAVYGIETSSKYPSGHSWECVGGGSSHMFSAAYGTDICPSSWTCCDMLDEALADAIHRPSTEEYTIENTFWALQASLSPTCILTPASAEEVSTAVKILGEKHCQFAIRGGGHTTVPGWANTNDGVLISMSRFKEITVKDGYVRVGAGNTWREVYLAVEKYNATVAGARISLVGVPGFLLGGGMTFLTAEQGFACDDVKNYELITGDGTILQVNAQTHPDLFIAMKGSSNNFGIVTNFDLFMFPNQARVFGGGYAYADNMTSELLSATADYAITGAISDVKSHVISAFAWTKETASIAPGVIVSYNGEADRNNPPEVLKPFADIPMLGNTTRMQTPSELTSNIGYFDGGRRQMLTSITVIADHALLTELNEIWRQELEFLKPNVVTSMLGFQPIPTTAIAAGLAKGGNSLGFKPEDKNLLITFWVATWTAAALDSTVTGRMKEIVARSTAEAQKRGLLHPFQYLDYAWDDQDPIASYGWESVQKLKQAKKKYDPNGVFTYLAKGGAKIPKSNDDAL